MLWTCVILGKKHFLAADDIHHSKTFSDRKNSFEAVRKTCIYPLLDNKAVNNNLDIVLFILIKLYFLCQLKHDTVNADTDKT